MSVPTGPSDNVRPVKRVKHGVLLAIAVAGVTSGCTTFSDNDAVARVDDVELSSDELQERLPAFVEGQAVPADDARDAINGWILEQVGGDPSASYDMGLEASGSVCVDVMVVVDEAAAADAVAAIVDQASFDAVFVEQNIDPSLVTDGGNLGCFGVADLPFGQGNPFVDALPTLNADDQVTSVSLTDQTGVAIGFAVARFQSFDELSADDQEFVRTNAPVDPERVAAADIVIDPRYGTFDPQFGAVPLG